MQIDPGCSARTSSAAVVGFMQTRTGVSSRWPTYPRALARMWNQVGNPSMFEGNTFFPLQAMPIACSARSNTRLADWLPDPLTVPTRIARSLTVAKDGAAPLGKGRVSTTETGDGMVRLKGTRAPRSVLQDTSGILIRDLRG